VVVYRSGGNVMQTDDATLAVVTVTAQKRPEAAQAVPIAMTTFSAKQIEDYRVGSLEDVSRLTPGLLVSAFSESNPTIAIRGTSNTFSQIGVGKPVAVVVDDVFIPRNSAANFNLFDLDSIAVLKGPQGTLFGRNVTGGAIVINTRKPALDKLEAGAQLTVANLDDKQFEGSISVPFDGAAAAKLSTSIRHRAGYGTDRLTGDSEDGIDSQNFHGQFLIVPSQIFEILFNGDFSNDKNGGRTLSSDTLGSDGDSRTSELGVHQAFKRTIAGGSIKMIWDDGMGELTSITAFRKSQSGETYSGVGANYKFLTSGSQSVTEDDDQVGTFSQEIRYASPKWQRGDFVSGVYYLDERGTRQLGNQGLAAQTGALTASTLANQAVDTTSYALFVDGALHVTPSLDLAGGVRYTVDRKRGSLQRTDRLAPSNSFADDDLGESWREWTPRVALDWQATRSAMAYASVTRGFTAGGFNADASSLKAFRQTFAPETVTNYEAGLKTQWLNDRLRLNMSVFDMKYKNKQELVNNTVTGILDIANAARATIKGVEIEVVYKPFSWMGLQLNYANLDARYDEFIVGTVNNTGHPLGSSPRNTYSAATNLNIPWSGRGFLVGSVNYFWTSNYYTGATKDPNLLIPSYSLANASFGFESIDHRYRLTTWVKNISDTDYILTRSTQVVRSEYLGAPRTYGVTFSVRY